MKLEAMAGQRDTRGQDEEDTMSMAQIHQAAYDAKAIVTVVSMLRGMVRAASMSRQESAIVMIWTHHWACDPATLRSAKHTSRTFWTRESDVIRSRRSPNCSYLEFRVTTHLVGLTNTFVFAPE